MRGSALDVRVGVPHLLATHASLHTVPTKGPARDLISNFLPIFIDFSDFLGRLPGDTPSSLISTRYVWNLRLLGGGYEGSKFPRKFVKKK